MMRGLAAAIAIFVLSSNLACGAEFKVMVATWRGCEEACTGFREGMARSGLDVEILLRDAERNEARIPGILAEARAKAVDLILTWGTSVSVGVAGTLDQLKDPAFNHDIPQIFMVVADPVGAGLVESLDRTGRSNLTGTYNRVPEEVNIDTIRAYLPGFRRLGLLYNANEANSVLKRDELAELTVGQGIELIARELPLAADGRPRVADIAAGVAALKAAGAEFLYIGSSSFLRGNGKALTTAAMEHRLPILSPYEELVINSHALVSVAARYYDVGVLAAEQARRILVGKALPGDLPVARMKEFAIVINLDVARRLGLFPPIGLLRVAETVN